ncbi:MAG: DinB family protein [Bacteroidetes bacterium]|nr:DinB family protein [Bacteroidota bacterium]
MQLHQAINNVFVQLSATLEQLSLEEYRQPCQALFGNSIGQHVRHIIELFQCLENGYDQGMVCYDKRKRDELIETDKANAIRLLHEIYTNIDRPDKAILLEASYDDHSDSTIKLNSNYYREIAYNLEHCIHHMALIRAGVREVSRIVLPENFGVAISTIKYQRQCAQ